MSFKKTKYGNFDPFTFRGEKIASPVPKNPGVYYFWYWDAEKEMYSTPPAGIKQYRAFRRRFAGGRMNRETKCFERLDDARRWRAFQDCDKTTLEPANDVRPAIKGGPKFEQVVELWKAAKWKAFAESTRLEYEKLLRYLEFFEGRDVRAITSPLIDEWLRQMTSKEVLARQHSTRQSYHHELTCLSGVLRYYSEYHDDPVFVFPIKRRHWEAAVVKKVRNRKREPMTPEQFEVWVSHLRVQKNGLMIEALARTQRSGALRISEAAGIQWGDIDWNRRFVTIRRSVVWPRKKELTTFIQPGFKNGDTKEVPLTPDAHRLLRERSLTRSCDLVFHRDKKPLEYRYVQYAYNRCFKEASLPFSATHVMRRTGTSWVLDKSGGDVGLAKQILGNADWGTVDLYAKRQANALREFNDKIWEKAEQDGELAH